MLRGSSQARMIRSSGTGSGWPARNRSTRIARVAAGTWLMPGSSDAPWDDPASDHSVVRVWVPSSGSGPSLDLVSVGVW